MDAFPADLTQEGVCALLQEGRENAAAAQQELLAKTRLRVYNQIKADVQLGAKSDTLPLYSTVELPDALKSEYKRQLARELCARFPGKVEYRRVVHYADEDEYVLIKDEANPPVSFEYRVHFE
jgi:hypothetical protein